MDDFSVLYRALREKGIIKSGRVVGDIGEYYACRKLGLTPAAQMNEKGYDAVDAQGVRYEIKTRRVYDSERRTTQSRRLNNLQGKSATYVVVVVLDREFACAGIWLVPARNISDPQNARLTLVNHTPGVKTVVKSRIPWLKNAAPLANQKSSASQKRVSGKKRGLKERVVPKDAGPLNSREQKAIALPEEKNTDAAVTKKRARFQGWQVIGWGALLFWLLKSCSE